MVMRDGRRAAAKSTQHILVRAVVRIGGPTVERTRYLRRPDVYNKAGEGPWPRCPAQSRQRLSERRSLGAGGRVYRSRERQTRRSSRTAEGAGGLDVGKAKSACLTIPTIGPMEASDKRPCLDPAGALSVRTPDAREATASPAAQAPPPVRRHGQRDRPHHQRGDGRLHGR